MYEKQKYKKQALTIKEQIQKLKNKGLIFKNEIEAEKMLATTNYYRLSGYWFNKLVAKNPDKFENGITFENIKELYDFDSKLRIILFEGISKIEISFRTIWAYQMGLLGAFAYLDFQNYNDNKEFQRTLDKLSKEFEHSKEIFVEHYKKCYLEKLPPVWIACELLSFGTLTRFYRNLNNRKLERCISDSFHIDQILLKSWLHSITVLRNFCAHHARIVNRIFCIAPKEPKSKKLAIYGLWNNTNKNSCYNIILVLSFMIFIVYKKGDNWNKKLVEFLKGNNDYAINSLGFPKNWQTTSFWNEFL